MFAALARSRFLPPLFVLSLAGITGCPDPQGSFDDFGKRYDKINSTTSSSTGGGGMPACSAPAPGVMDGDWLFALTTKLGPTKPLVFKMTVTTADNAGMLSVSWKATPLSYMDQMTPVGAEINLASFDVAPDGTFVAAQAIAQGITEAEIVNSSYKDLRSVINGIQALAELADLKQKQMKRQRIVQVQCQNIQKSLLHSLHQVDKLLRITVDK